MARNLPNQGNTAIVLTPSNMHTAFDPDGRTVWCSFAQQEAHTNDGFCQFCGATDHRMPRHIPGLGNR
jgi:hypothetical protein